jgi:hypothetical protein
MSVSTAASLFHPWRTPRRGLCSSHQLQHQAIWQRNLEKYTQKQAPDQSCQLNPQPAVSDLLFLAFCAGLPVCSRCTCSACRQVHLLLHIQDGTALNRRCLGHVQWYATDGGCVLP